MSELPLTTTIPINGKSPILAPFIPESTLALSIDPFEVAKLKKVLPTYEDKSSVLLVTTTMIFHFSPPELSSNFTRYWSGAVAETASPLAA